MLLQIALMPVICRFVRVAQLPDDLEMLLDEQRLGVRAAFALIAFFPFNLTFICRYSRQRFVPASPAPTASSSAFQTLLRLRLSLPSMLAWSC